MFFSGRRLKVLKVREDHVRSVLDEARRRLGEVTKDPTRYSEILSALILQGLYQIMEPKTLIKSREGDQSLIKDLLPKAVEEYKSKMGKSCVVTLNPDSFLAADTCGGIELLALNGRLRVSTLVICAPLFLTIHHTILINSFFLSKFSCTHTGSEHLRNAFGINFTTIGA